MRGQASVVTKLEHALNNIWCPFMLNDTLNLVWVFLAKTFVSSIENILETKLQLLWD